VRRVSSACGRLTVGAATDEAMSRLFDALQGPGAQQIVFGVLVDFLRLLLL
jgi:hypothetical protein